ncbi:MAG: hypothetical protein IJ193_02000 [Bacilli bacterium]|nr:hypothetical protein [Bacilli bacterium]
MKKKLLLLAVFLFLLSGCSDKEQPIVEENVNLRDVYLEVLLNSRSYIDSNGVEMNFNGYMNQYSEMMDYVPASYVYVDLNGDGYEEMVVAVDANDRYYLILHYEKKIVYGYPLNGRGMMHLKTDGSYYASGGADVGSIQKALFAGNKITERSIASRNGDSYYIGDEAVTANRYATYYNEFATKKDVQFTGSKTYSTKEESKNIYGTYYLLDKKGNPLKDGSGTITISPDGYCTHISGMSNLGCKSFEVKDKKICFSYFESEDTCYTFKNTSLVKGTDVYTKSS